MFTEMSFTDIIISFIFSFKQLVLFTVIFDNFNYNIYNNTVQTFSAELFGEGNAMQFPLTCLLLLLPRSYQSSFMRRILWIESDDSSSL